MAVHLHQEDLPADVRFADGPIAVDTEAMGLHFGRDRLCLVQLSDGKGDEHLVQFRRGSDFSAPNLKALLGDPNVHEARGLAIGGIYLIGRIAALVFVVAVLACLAEMS